MQTRSSSTFFLTQRICIFRVIKGKEKKKITFLYISVVVFLLIQPIYIYVYIYISMYMCITLSINTYIDVYGEMDKRLPFIKRGDPGTTKNSGGITLTAITAKFL